MQFQKGSKDNNLDFSKYIVYLVFVIVFIIFSITLGSQGFATSVNILNIMRQTAMISVISVAMTFLIATGGIDLSVGAVAALSALTSALVLQSTNNIPLAILASLGVGLLIGSINGLLVTKLRIPPFLATLGVMYIVRGIAMRSTNTAAVPIRNTLFCTIFGTGTIGGFPLLLLWTIAFVVVGALVLNKTSFGKKVLATGGNETAAKFTGIDTNRIKLITFVMCSTFASFAGIMYAARVQTGRYSLGDGDEMSAIAAVVLGGASMQGGTGSVIGALVGSILMGMINNALILAGLSISEQTIVKGIIIVFAVALSNISGKRTK